MGVKRPRPIRSCFFCQKRKISCNHGIPCSSCIKYKNINCEYPTNEEYYKLKKTKASKVGRNKSNYIKHKEHGNFGFVKNTGDKNTTHKEVHDYEGKTRHTEHNHNNFTYSNNLVDPIESVSATEANRTWPQNGDFESPNDLNEFISEMGEIPDSIELNLRKLDEEIEIEDTVNDEDWGEINLSKQCNNLLYIDEPVKRRYFGPIGWNGIIRADPFLDKLWNIVFVNLNNDDKLNFVVKLPLPKDLEVTLDNDESDFFLQRVRNGEGVSSLKELTKVDPLKIIAFDNSESTDGHLKLIEEIKLALPDGNIVELLIDRYFKIIYNFIPVIEMKEFKEDLSKVWINHSLVFNNKFDLIIIGQFLIILRISYISLFNSTKIYYPNNNDNNANNNNANNFEEEEELNYLRGQKVGLNILKLCQSCVNQFNLFTSTNIKLFQLLVLLKFYQIHGPEFGEGPDHGDSQIMSSLILQMGFLLGVHIDNKYKQTWDYLVISDAQSYLTLGDCNNINKYGIKLSNNNDPIVNLVIELNETTNNLNNCKIKQLNLLINKYDNLITLDIRPGENKIFKITNFIVQKFQIYNFKLSIFNHYFLYFNKMELNRVANNYLIKSFYISYNKILPILIDIFITQGRPFKTVIDFIVLPFIQIVIHKMCLLNISIIIRLKIYTQNEALSSICDKLFKLTNHLISFISNLSNRYYFAWRTTRVQSFLLQCTNYDLKLFFKDVRCKFTLNQPEINNLDRILTTALNDIEFNHNFKMFSQSFQPIEFTLNHDFDLNNF